MATRNIVPRNTNEGSLGTQNKKWNSVYAETITANRISGVNLLERNKTYAVGDIAVSPKLKSYQYLECVTAGTTGDTEPDFSTVTTGGVINDGFGEFILRSIKDGYMVGDLSFRPYVAKGWVKAIGETVNRADYPTLVSFANENGLWTSNQTNEPWKFGQGNGSTTMVLPNYAEQFVEGGSTAGKKTAGLPEISGTLISRSPSDKTIPYTPSGAFTTNESSDEREYATYSLSSNTYKGYEIHFNASKSNNVYGASNTVQPPAIVLIPQIKY